MQVMRIFSGIRFSREIRNGKDIIGGIAQLVEHRPFKAGVDGSSPSALTI